MLIPLAQACNLSKDFAFSLIIVLDVPTSSLYDATQLDVTSSLVDVTTLIVKIYIKYPGLW